MAQDDEDEEDEDVLLDGGPPSPASPDRESDTLQERGDNIRVFVRVRPLNAREESAHLRDSICVDTDTGAVHLLGEPPRSFAFDGVLGVSASQEDVFQLFGTSVAEACLSGYNGSIYAYGQTGSGKTFTMQGGVNSVQSMQQDPSRGLMCRILEFIFDEISRRHLKGGSVQHSCKCSYLEIYKEQITDLLEPSSYLQIREDINRGIYVERLSEHSVWTASDAFHVLWKGLHQRHVASTQMNELSSRSHSVFTLKLEASSTTAGGVTSTKVARLNLIDLAGSERQSFDPHQPSTHESLRVKEAGAINRSLSALTNVIMSLSQRRAGQRQPFVRYRDSKLTFLLRDSLGGNSKTHIAACVSPSAMCFGETLSTLKFAARAKHIRCTAVMNEEYSGTVESLMLEVKSLRQQLDLLSSRGLLGDGEVEDIIMQSPKGMAQRGAKAAREEEEALEALVLERLEAAGCREELQSLYGSRRVRRLEILLAAALDRERRCELRRHKMDKYSQYLNYTLEKKETYFDALRDYFSSLVDYAAGEACYLPEFTARLVVFRQQLCNASTDSSRQQATEMLDGTIEAFLDAEADGLLDDGDESPTGIHMSSQRWLAQEFSSKSRSYSYGLLIGEAARRNGRRSTSRMQLGSTAALAGSSLPEGEGSEQSHSLGVGGPSEQLGELWAENKQRQLESHPELFRLSAENRLLREHLASLKQQKAAAQEPDFFQGRGKSQSSQPEKEMSLARTTSRLLSVDANEEGDKKVGEGKFQAPKHFPGIEEVTHLSSSDSESEDRPREAGLLDRGVYADANSFLPAMARQVQDLFRVKNGMEDLLRRRLSAQKATSPVQGDRFIRANVTPDQEVEVDPQELAEALQGATEALQNAEAMVAKGGCGELFVGADEPHAPDHGRRSEGMDERDVFLSLMRSLPGESQALNRQGFAASVPQLEPFDSESDRMSSLRSTSSISSGGGRLTRMKSTMQLHRIVEAPSLQEMAETVREGSSRQPPSSPSETLQLAVQQVQNLCKQLEGVGEVYRDVKAQLEPMQQEYLRRQEECRFLEAQCRRLDVHCRLLENRVQAAEASGALRAPQPQPFNPDAQLPAPGARRFIPVAQAQAPVVGMARMSIMAHVASALLAAPWISGNPTPVAFAEPPFLSTRAVIAQPRRPAMQALRDGAQAWSSSFAFLCAVTAANGVNHARRIETHSAKASWCVLGSPKQRTPKQCARG
ncbi:unnamed protein product [Effrenium voratum]|nr:unnamed protein product [Effrenium voratum]